MAAHSTRIANTRNRQVRRVRARLRCETERGEAPIELGVDLTDFFETFPDAKPDRSGWPGRRERAEPIEREGEGLQRHAWLKRANKRLEAIALDFAKELEREMKVVGRDPTQRRHVWLESQRGPCQDVRE